MQFFLAFKIMVRPKIIKSPKNTLFPLICINRMFSTFTYYPQNFLLRIFLVMSTRVSRDFRNYEPFRVFKKGKQI
ncbi:MAG: hypothetical protein Ct9H300mP4_00840 [Gammaproteobacteria bacterium]|nr:MAG: hypothetical protein Ct9H300mP4_00840 [Gammaproteobacteria bacterium]